MFYLWIDLRDEDGVSYDGVRITGYTYGSYDEARAGCVDVFSNLYYLANLIQPHMEDREIWFEIVQTGSGAVCWELKATDAQHLTPLPF